MPVFEYHSAAFIAIALFAKTLGLDNVFQSICGNFVRVERKAMYLFFRNSIIFWLFFTTLLTTCTQNFMMIGRVIRAWKCGKLTD